MLTWLLLLAVAGFVFHLNSRLRRLEERFDDLQAYHYAPAEPELAAPPVEQEAGAPPIGEPTEAAEPRRPAVVLHAESRPAEVTADRIETIDDDARPEPRSWRPSIGFEELFGRRLPIWAGGITLAVAGMLIVKLSIDSGLLTPPIRVIAGLVFGGLLMAGAELALRFDERVRDPRVRQALAGAGVACLYASVLVAVNLYHLIDPLTAMFGMAAVTALALFLSIRFGPPSALLGLAGGLAAPAMVGSTEPNVPLLSVYLSLAVGGLCTLSRNQRWAWLGISALVGGFGWGILLLVGGILDTPSSISLGLYLLLLGVAIPALGFAGTRKSQLQLISGILAAAQMAALVATGGFALVNWGLFALLSIASVWLAERGDPVLARLPAIGLVVALLLMGAWTSPPAGSFALVLGGFVLIYGAPAVWRLWRSGGLVEAAEIGALGLGALLLPMFHYHHADGSNDALFGLLAAGSAAAVGACAALGWNDASRRNDARFALLSIVTAVLLSGAALLFLPTWAAGVAISLLGLALLHLGQVADDARFEPAAWIVAGAGVLVYPISQLFDGTDFNDSVDALHWAAQAAIVGMFAWRAHFTLFRRGAQFLAPAFAYLAVAAVVAEWGEPLIAPAILIATAAFARRIDQRLVPAMASSLMIVVAWAIEPMLEWTTGAAASLVSSPMLVTDVPLPLDVLTQLLVPAAAIATALFIAVRLRRLERIGGWTIAGVLAAVGVHSLYKQLFAIASPEAFVTFGLAERTIWELAIAALALLAFRLRRPLPALILAIAAAFHEAFYTLLLHNPLWSAQAVGRWPALNLLAPVYVLALAFTVAAKRTLQPVSEEMARAVQVVQMALVVLFAFSELRQLFHGTMLTASGLPGAEDISRSILAIALAIGFLLWGISRQQRDWRIASLALMLGAVGKVFLFDASGLAGVTRIASFVALGLSLIGIGWLYSRHLGSDRAAAPA